MICKKCGDEVVLEELKTPSADALFAMSIIRMQEKFIERGTCDNCNKEESQNSSNLSRLSQWGKICPLLYRDTDVSRLDNSVVEKANSWIFSEKGFGLVGESGKGKTRAIFHRLKREHLNGKSIHYQTGPKFARRLADPTKSRIEIDDCIYADILFLDDLDKAKFTERVEADLIHVIEERNKRLKPIIFAVNASGKQLSEMFSDNRSEPILRRLREFCEVHVFTAELKVVA